MATIPNPKLDISEYPDTLYRIHFPNVSYTLYDSDDGFECCATGRIDICNYFHLLNEFETHLNWNSGEPSHFISMFGRRRHAINWARDELRRGRARSAVMMEINPYEIQNAYGRHIPILRVRDVIAKHPNLRPDGVKKGWVDDEYLALYKIPSDAITSTTQIDL